MSRYVEITKDGNNYTVNPNASGGSLTLNTGIPVMLVGDDPSYYDAILVAITADGDIISSADNLGNAKWWLNLSTGAGSNRYCYTTGTDNYPFEDTHQYGIDVGTYTECTITYDNGHITIYRDFSIIDNLPYTMGTFELGKALVFRISS